MSPIEFRPAGILEKQLGLPTAEDWLSPEVVRRADAEILTRYPKLREAEKAVPDGYVPIAKDAAACAKHPFRLVRFMVPPGFMDRSVVMLGMAMTITTPLLAQAQALWATAYLGGKGGVRTRERCPGDLVEGMGIRAKREGVDVDVVWEMALHTQFGVHRCPGGFGKRNPDFVFDAIPYVDLLLADLGLNVRRKAWWSWVKPYGVADYRGLVEEWLGTQ
ncbi:hypothetical protein BO71DRAFT_403101 [Aspergillus ellipticus CBS 707.79]|uniref:Uncharacterized protein n=1 Tax=Aspergillus ellipticus CBS 707.79 TaxID=1448320 RepID=A0A319CWI2_9EURO|nr:hypothetical protein BO71DRAFT_403101 [Aspergillus ellipticus CBS 707.79]